MGTGMEAEEDLVGDAFPVSLLSRLAEADDPPELLQPAFLPE